MPRALLHSALGGQWEHLAASSGAMKQRRRKKQMRIWIAALALAMTLPSTIALAVPPKAIRLEAADAQLVGVTLGTAIPGYTGKGYAGDFAPQGAKIVFTVPDAAPGVYKVSLRYSAPSGDKGYDLVVNGAKFSGMLPKTGNVFATQPAGKVELAAGRNTLAIERGWGYYDINSRVVVQLFSLLTQEWLFLPLGAAVRPLVTIN